MNKLMNTNQVWTPPWLEPSDRLKLMKSLNLKLLPTQARSMPSKLLSRMKLTILSERKAKLKIVPLKRPFKILVTTILMMSMMNCNILRIKSKSLELWKKPVWI